MPKVPTIPMIKILSQFAYTNKMFFNPNCIHSINLTFIRYNKVASKLN